MTTKVIQEPSIDRYISGLAGTEVSRRPFDVGRLPAYIRQRYELEQLEVAGRVFGAIHVRKPEEFSPGQFWRHLRALPSEFQNAHVVIARTLPSYVRNRMVAHNIPFVVPGVQMFWPQLGIAVRERPHRKPLLTDIGTLLPATQLVLISAALGSMRERITVKDAAQRFGYTPMTMTRVFNELEIGGLARSERVGHDRCLHFIHHGRSLWETAKPKLRSPVRHTVRIERSAAISSSALLAGESALSQLSMLEAPREVVYAIDLRLWRDLSSDVERLPPGEENACQLQIWNYNPQSTASEGRVDPLSLFLSLEDVNDERVASARRQMMEKVPW